MIHRKESPICYFIVGRSNNVPIGAGQEISSSTVDEALDSGVSVPQSVPNNKGKKSEYSQEVKPNY